MDFSRKKIGVTSISNKTSNIEKLKLHGSQVNVEFLVQQCILCPNSSWKNVNNAEKKVNILVSYQSALSLRLCINIHKLFRNE